MQVAELHDLADATDTKGKVAAAKADELAEEAADLRDEMVALRKSHLKTREELDVEKARTDELGLELLKVWAMQPLYHCHRPASWRDRHLALESVDCDRVTTERVGICGVYQRGGLVIPPHI